MKTILQWLIGPKLDTTPIGKVIEISNGMRVDHPKIPLQWSLQFRPEHMGADEHGVLGPAKEAEPKPPTASELAWTEELRRRKAEEECEEEIRAYDRKRKARR